MAEPREEHLFGRLARQMKLLDGLHVQEALRTQKEDSPGRKIGEILVGNGRLSLRDVQKILLEQQRRRQTDVAGKALPEKVGPYQVISLLGSSSMSSVYLAQDPGRNRTVAVKVLSARLAGDSEFVARFEREVQAVSALSHPNIVGAFASGMDEERPYLVMEYIAGRSLGKILEAQKLLDERRALEICGAIARALDHAHQMGIIHRDVKPDNVLIGNDGAIKLADFGLARLLREEQRLTQSGIALGTPHYISPEQVADGRYIDHRADLYSLGAVLFHMLSGRVPFEGETNNDIMLKHLDQPLQVPASIHGNTLLILNRLMAKKAAERYEMAAHTVTDIERALNNQKPLFAETGLAQGAAQSSSGDEKKGCAVFLLFFLCCILGFGCWLQRTGGISELRDLHKVRMEVTGRLR